MQVSDRPNIIWVVIDALRADHTTMDGYIEDTTPELSAIAQKPGGRYFSNCFSQTISTRPSVTSMLTGVYPSVHGVNMIEHAVPDELRTVPEVLADEGYHSAAISRNSHVSRATGLHRGFDRFDWFGSVRSLLSNVDADILIRYLLGIRRHSIGFSTELVDHSIAFVVNELAKRNIQELKGHGEPFFIFLHYLGPHDPYVPALPYRKRYLNHDDIDPTHAVRRVKQIFENRWEYNTGKRTLSTTDVELLNAMYDSEIAHTDAAVGRLFDFVESLSLENETVFVVTSDHGELLGERGVVGHELHLDDELVRVPLVVHGTETDCPGTDAFIQHIDVVNTLLTQIVGDVDQFQGMDLRSESRDQVVTERCQPLDFDDLRGFNPDFDESSVHGTGMTALRDREFKYLRSETKTELYNLPDERSDVTEAYPETVARMEDQLNEWEQEFATPVESTRESDLDEEMKRQLSDLGYRVE
jgi:uncharacterized sulfatase